MKTRWITRPIKPILVLLILSSVLGYVINKTLVSSSESLNYRSVSTREHPKHENETTTDDWLSVNHSLSTSNKKLPSFRQGGVIVWIHIPKTGGTTIRKSLQRRQGIIYLFSNRRSKYDELVGKVDEWVTNGPRDQSIGILEVHARNNPTLMELSGKLQQWRDTAKAHQVPFFAFTIVRDPISFAYSYFNYYHLIQWEKRRFEFLSGEDITEANFRRTMHFNPQCLFLTRSEQAYQRNFPEKRANLTKSECDGAYQFLQANMDWVGITERLHNETMPLLQQLTGSGMTGLKRQGLQTSRHENAGPKLFGPANISSDTLEYIRDMNLWDTAMYENIKREYNFRDIGLSL